MKTRQLFLLLFAAILSSAAFADEIGSGVIEPPPGSNSTTTVPGTSVDDPEATTDSEAVSDGDSLLQQLLDWIA